MMRLSEGISLCSQDGEERLFAWFSVFWVVSGIGADLAVVQI
jgi:hypothetical protein